MGMFDSLWVDCPKCGERMEFQSKAGSCVLADYDLNNCPPEIAGDLIGECSFCDCGHAVVLRGAVVLFPEHR